MYSASSEIVEEKDEIKKLFEAISNRAGLHFNGDPKPASIKKALRDFSLSKASEMAAVKRISYRCTSPQRIRSLYDMVVFDQPILKPNIPLNNKGEEAPKRNTPLEKKREEAPTRNILVEKKREVAPKRNIPVDGNGEDARNSNVPFEEEEEDAREPNIPFEKKEAEDIHKGNIPVGTQKVKIPVGKKGETRRSNIPVEKKGGDTKTRKIPQTELNLQKRFQSGTISRTLKQKNNSARALKRITIKKKKQSVCEKCKCEVESDSEKKEREEISLTSKSSGGECSTSTSNSEGTSITRPSCGIKPHKSKDFKWEQIRSAKHRDGFLSLNHFNLLKKLGGGDIGTVYLAELIGSSSLFAIKVMDNEFLSRRNKMQRAHTEREILKILDHPFLPTLYTQFTFDNLSCLVMEYCPGGDLHVLRQMQPGRCFSEAATRFYLAEVLLALEYLHMLGIIYRDLKPENVLVGEDGHIMLTDFDLSLTCEVYPMLRESTVSEQRRMCIQPCFRSKPGKTKAEIRRARSLPEVIVEPNARSSSFVGTHEYLAPEIIKGEGHGAAVDWWTLGVFAYEMVYGRTPFKGRGNEETLGNVLAERVRFPEGASVSGEARDLMRRLLVKEPERRLGWERGATEIKSHPFFGGLNWALVRCMVPPETPQFQFPALLLAQSQANHDHLEFELF